MGRARPRSYAIPVVACVVVIMMLLTGCQLIPIGSRGPGGPNAPASSGPAATASQPELPEAEHDRDLLEIPDVEPPGFRSPPPGTGTARYRDQGIDWEPCAQDNECADIAVPLDHDDPDSQAITIALRRSSTEEDSRGTIFVNPGGPGASGWDMVDRYPRGLYGYDVVGWDPRGVGRSTPVQCLEGSELDEYYDLDATPDDAAEERALIMGNREFTTSCLAQSGRLLEHISTEDTVKDLDLMRQLVGDDKLNYLGYSYGTEIGAVYAELFGDSVGHLVLDSAVNITSDESIIQAQGFDRALDHFAEWCAADGCSLGASAEEVITSVTDLLTTLDASPLPVGDRQLTQSLATLGTLVPLYQDESVWPYLAQALEQAVDGDGSTLLSFADSYNQRDESGQYGELQYAFNAIRCLDNPDEGLVGAERDFEVAKEKAPMFGRFSGADVVCPLWPVAAVEPVRPITGAEVDVPILIIGTTGDSATPYEYAETMAAELQTGVLLTFDGEGHGAFGGGNKCIDTAVRDYFVDDQAPPEGTRCT